MVGGGTADGADNRRVVMERMVVVTALRLLEDKSALAMVVAVVVDNKRSASVVAVGSKLSVEVAA